jgi:hypothetical protein
MSFRTDLLKNVVLPLLRLPGPTSEGGIFDVYTYSIVVRTRTWASGKVGTDVSTATVSDLTLLPRPRVREDGDKFLVVEGIVASNPKGGYTLAQLRPTTSAGVEYYYRVTGANGTHAYELIDIDTSSAFLYSLRLQALTRATPF